MNVKVTETTAKGTPKFVEDTDGRYRWYYDAADVVLQIQTGVKICGYVAPYETYVDGKSVVFGDSAVTDDINDFRRAVETLVASEMEKADKDLRARVAIEQASMQDSVGICPRCGTYCCGDCQS